ncbi:MAG: hypothetical protein M1834_008456 [Cirrosporium novae-zelandiae]|nr:MAG: hypothetical protein M1834_008456 [Cirrosporium novae-zelandiae]
MAFSDIFISRHVTLRLAAALSILCISSFSYGFDTSTYSTVQAMTAFEKKFGSYDQDSQEWSLDATHLAFLNSFPLITYAVGIPIAQTIGERFGRRPVLVMTQLLCLTGIAVTYTASSYHHVLAGRMLVGGHVGMEAWLIPMFLGELAPASIRGSTVILYVISHLFGSFICSCVTYKSSQLSGDISWRMPFKVAFAFPCFVVVFSWLVPESPRWLVRRGRLDDAVASLRYLFGSNAVYTPEKEIKDISASLEQAKTKGAWADLLRGANRRRTSILFVSMLFHQLTGQSFVSQYGVLFVKSLHSLNPFTFSLITVSLILVGPLLAMVLVDRIGRRNMWIYGGMLCVLTLMIMGALGCGHSTATASNSEKSGIVAMSILFPFFYFLSFGSVGVLTAAEVPHVTLRDKSALIAWLASDICDFVVTYTLPYLLNAPYANLQSKVGFIYGSVGALGIVWGIFYLPELKNRSLEEVDELFEQHLPAWKFKSWKPSSDSVGARVTAFEQRVTKPSLTIAERDLENQSSDEVSNSSKQEDMT